jgi:hypothetical protein
VVNKKYRDDAEAIADLTSSLVGAIPTLELKTASASRAGNRVQARLTWKEGGKKQLGYVSVPVIKGQMTGISPASLVESVFRLDARAYAAIEQSAESGSVHQANRRKRNQKRARKALASTLDYVLQAGISDDEVHEMLKEALVRHTMES